MLEFQYNECGLVHFYEKTIHCCWKCSSDHSLVLSLIDLVAIVGCNQQ